MEEEAGDGSLYLSGPRDERNLSAWAMGGSEVEEVGSGMEGWRAGCLLMALVLVIALGNWRFGRGWVERKEAARCKEC